MMRTEAPKDLAGRGFVNFARTTPELPAEHQSAKPVPHIRIMIDWSLPCGLVTLPQMTRILVPRTSF
jgi:hypothetical protein